VFEEAEAAADMTDKYDFNTGVLVVNVYDIPLSLPWTAVSVSNESSSLIGRPVKDISLDSRGLLL